MHVLYNVVKGKRIATYMHTQFHSQLLIGKIDCNTFQRTGNFCVPLPVLIPCYSSLSLIYYADSEQRKSTQPEPKNGKEDKAKMEPQQTNNNTQQHAEKVQPEDETDGVGRGMQTMHRCTCQHLAHYKCINADSEL